MCFSLFLFSLTRGSVFVVTNHGINAGDVKKLQDAGIYTCNGLMMHTKKVKWKFCIQNFIILNFSYLVNYFITIFQNLTGIKGLSEAKVDKICEAAEKIVVRNFNFQL